MTQNSPNKWFIKRTIRLLHMKNQISQKEYFKQYNFQDYKFISRHGAQCYVLWRETDIVIVFRGTEPKQWSDINCRP